MKRFTDTKKWSDLWFQDLAMKYKLFWLYILDECDVAGVWKPNIKLAQFQIGEPFEESELKRIFKDRITVLENDYWYIKKFVDFQYGKLSKNSNPHQAVIKSLEKHKIKIFVSDESEGYLGTLKDKDKDKEQGKDKDKDQVQEQPLQFGEYQKDKPFITIQPRQVNKTPCRINGTDGLKEYLEANMSILNFPEWANKFMIECNGNMYNDLMHLRNAYKVFVDNQFK